MKARNTTILLNGCDPKKPNASSVMFVRRPSAGRTYWYNTS
jgi:hypothetical protein